ncbi:IclR family transcriptional regulator [Agromyces humatus]|uniref:IclR family transcriptional regulator n=1 Tax=Agromyces humatus TaxID=279573 RepID=A0ABP4X5R7_9MICO|nr:IclR family transcriptional regulator [Agromyces humatus]
MAESLSSRDASASAVIGADSSLERGLAILEVIAAPGEHTPAAIAAAVGLPPSTTYRYLRRLGERGFVAAAHGRYEPGPSLIGLAGGNFATTFLASVAPAVLAGIVDEVGETAVMIVRVGTHAVCVSRAEPDKAIRYTFAVNQLLPLHAGAGQRVLLAWAPPSIVERVVASGLTRYTDATLDAARLRASLHATRQAGWTVSRGEYDTGSVSVAVPVFFGGEAVCSLNVAGPESRCGSREWVARVRTLLSDAARDLSESLEAWSPPTPAPTESSTPIDPEIT